MWGAFICLSVRWHHVEYWCLTVLVRRALTIFAKRLTLYSLLSTRPRLNRLWSLQNNSRAILVTLEQLAGHAREANHLDRKNSTIPWQIQPRLLTWFCNYLTTKRKETLRLSTERSLKVGSLLFLFLKSSNVASWTAVLNRINDLWEDVIADCQHWFWSGRSCVTNLLETLDYIVAIPDRAGQVDCVYLDMSKAFDKVRHDLLMEKLRDAGFGGNLLTWFHAYLCGRRQRVTVIGATSRDLSITSGVPQGSILGPALFLLYVKKIQILSS